MTAALMVGRFAMQGIDDLRKAKGILHGQTGDGRDRLRVAAHFFWSAVFHSESWPADLRSKAETLTARIFRYGTIDQAVCRMGDATAAEIGGELIRLCEDAERSKTPDPGVAARHPLPVEEVDGRNAI